MTDRVQYGGLRLYLDGGEVVQGGSHGCVRWRFWEVGRGMSSVKVESVEVDGVVLTKKARRFCVSKKWSCFLFFFFKMNGY